MCGRFVIDITREDLSKRFQASVKSIQLVSSYNVTPGSFIQTVIHTSPNAVVSMKWGLVPNWSREFKVKFSTINARSENLKLSPVYRIPYKKQRCLIPAMGFYEWKILDGKRKQPYFIHLKDEKIFAFAGLYDIWKDAEEKEFYTCTIVTTNPNTVMKSIHNRMPVILKHDDEQSWLNDDTTEKDLDSLLVPYAASEMESYPVNARVNNPIYDDPSLIEKENN